jgi:hypothetical protein
MFARERGEREREERERGRERGRERERREIERSLNIAHKERGDAANDKQMTSVPELRTNTQHVSRSVLPPAKPAKPAKPMRIDRRADLKH